VLSSNSVVGTVLPVKEITISALKFLLEFSSIFSSFITPSPEVQMDTFSPFVEPEIFRFTFPPPIFFLVRYQ